MFKSSYPGELFNFGTVSISLTVSDIHIQKYVLQLEFWVAQS